MKASTQYNDFIGTVAADISDNVVLKYNEIDKFDSIAKFLKLNEKKFKLIGISINGTSSLGLSLICIDKENSINDEKIVKLSYDIMNEEQNILDMLFKRFEFVLYEKNDTKYPDVDNLVVF
ncbi:hypothetical protein [Capnocytophaga canis]|uniref:hypothetical protein n=1 Tax=Capnocytophaga canis TaxID=1848903 RepID=UPI0037D246E7